MQEISGFGLTVRVIASTTFPSGFTVAEFAEDVDPFDLPELQISDAAMGLNGDMISWSKPTPISFSLGVIPKSDSDKNLAVLFEANRAARGKVPAKDIITIVGVYADGSSITLSSGKCFSSIPGNSVASAGRYKSKPYNFRFEQLTRTEA